MDQNLIVNALRSATEDVFSTMLAMEMVAGEPYMAREPAGPNGGIISVIGMTGSWIGTGSLQCDAHFARRISSALLMSEMPEVGEEVLDALAEITNIIIGNFKTTVEGDLSVIELSIPTVIYGLSFTARSARKEQWMVVPFRCGQDHLIVKVCLRQSRTAPQVTPAILACAQ